MKKKSLPKEKPHPDHQLNSLENSESVEDPKIYKIVRRSSKNSNERRQFLKNIALFSGAAGIGKLLTSCTTSDYAIDSDGEKCTCHIVCSCDAVERGDDAEKAHWYDADWKSEYSGDICQCDTVCTCHTVCTCDTVDLKNDERHTESESVYNGGVCTCNSVCSCNTVCTCNAQCGCDGNSSSSCGGGGYWYPN